MRKRERKRSAWGNGAQRGNAVSAGAAACGTAGSAIGNTVCFDQRHRPDKVFGCFQHPRLSGRSAAGRSLWGAPGWGCRGDVPDPGSGQTADCPEKRVSSAHWASVPFRTESPTTGTLLFIMAEVLILLEGLSSEVRPLEQAASPPVEQPFLLQDPTPVLHG